MSKITEVTIPQFEGLKEFTPEYNKVFLQWCKSTKTLYYARPAELFNNQEAYSIAEEIGLNRIILENLS